MRPHGGLRTTEAVNSSPLHDHSSSSWRFSLPVIKLTGGELVYRDSRWPENETLRLQPEEVVTSDLSSDMTEFPFQFRTRVGDGRLTGEGRVQLSPFGLQLSLQPSELEVGTLEPLLTPILAAKKARGKVTGTLQTNITEQDGVQVIHTHGVVRKLRIHP